MRGETSPTRTPSFRVDSPVPVLQVADVARSMEWYARVFGFRANPFPDAPPYSFAILQRDGSEIMLQRGPADAADRPRAGWSVYLRVTGGRLRELAEAARAETGLVREPQLMPYRQVEFDVVDPDGHVVCVAEPEGEPAGPRVYALNLFNVSNRDEYLAYARRSAREVARHGGRVVALGKFREAPIGDVEPRSVLILVEWESPAAFEAYRNDPALADLHPHRVSGTAEYVWHLFDRLDDLRPILTEEGG